MPNTAKVGTVVSYCDTHAYVIGNSVTGVPLVAFDDDSSGWPFDDEVVYASEEDTLVAVELYTGESRQDLTYWWLHSHIEYPVLDTFLHAGDNITLKLLNNRKKVLSA